MSSESQPVDTDQHTPYCDDNCNVNHHPLLQTIIGLKGSNKVELDQCIAKYKAHGWGLDDPIPDPVADFRFPILHWVAALTKNNLVSHLIKEGCSTTLTRNGDTPLHRCIICLKPRNKRGHLMVGHLASNLPIVNGKGQTPLLQLAERLDHGQITPDQFSDWLIAILEATMKMVDVGQRLKTFNTQNQQGDTALHLLCNVRSMLPSVRRMVQEARCNVKIRNKLGLTAMDVALNGGFYDYVTEIKSVLPAGTLLVSPLRSSHPLAKTKKSPVRQRTLNVSNTRRETEKPKKTIRKRSRSADKREKEERLPPTLERVKPQTPEKIKPPKLDKVKPPTTPTENNNQPKESESPPPSPSSSSKRPRKGTPYRVDRTTKEDQEQRMRASNLDRILQSQCEGTPVRSEHKSVGSKPVSDEVCQCSENEPMDASSSGATTSSGEYEEEDRGHHSLDDKCVMCNLESGSKMPHQPNGSKVSELQVSTAAEGPGSASEPDASGKGGGDAFERESQGNSKLLTYLQMNQDFQKEIVNKIHKDRRELEKMITEQEGSVQVTAKELAKVTSETNDVERLIATTLQKLEILQTKQKALKTKQEKLRKTKRGKEGKLGESRTQLAVIAQSLHELQG